VITTRDLIDIVCQNQRRTVEACLLLNGCLATHFLRCLQDKKLHDIGIGSEVVYWEHDEFLRHYSNASWVIQQIV
jgi:hypothetical protein